MKATKASQASKKSVKNNSHKSKAKKKVAKAKVKTVQKAVAKPIVKKATTKATKEKVTVVTQKTEVQVVTAKTSATDSRVDTRNLTEGQLENYKKWLKFQKQLSDKAPEHYSMNADFEVKTPLQHKTHGWGVVVQKRDNYIDVLFESGLKTLIVNYKQD